MFQNKELNKYKQRLFLTEHSYVGLNLEHHCTLHRSRKRWIRH